MNTNLYSALKLCEEILAEIDNDIANERDPVTGPLIAKMSDAMVALDATVKLLEQEDRGCICGGAVKAIDSAYVAGFRNGRNPNAAEPPGLHA